jgi:hypothetical protein
MIFAAMLGSAIALVLIAIFGVFCGMCRNIDAELRDERRLWHGN